MLASKALSKRNEIEFVDLRNQARRRIGEDTCKHNEKLIEDVTDRNKSLKKVQATINAKRKWIWCIKKNGVGITYREGILKAVTEFYEVLYGDTDEDIKNNESDKDNEFLPIMKDEVKNALKNVKNNRVSGDDEILSEYF